MTESQLATLLLEESGTFEGASPVTCEMCKSGEYARKQFHSGEGAVRFSHETQESIAWIDGRMSISF